MRWMAIALVLQRRPKKNESEIQSFEILSVSRGKTWGLCLTKGGQTTLRVSGHARNLTDFSCWDTLASCTSNCSQIGVTPFFTPVILRYSKRVILLYSKRPHGTSICSGEDATSRSIDLTSLILAADNFPSGWWKNTLRADSANKHR